jgi:Asp/Glu/hydantoin racemase
MRDRPIVFLVNGNSTEAVTSRLAGLARAVAPDFEILPSTTRDGPAYISTPSDVAVSADRIVAAIGRAVDEHGSEPACCIIACFGEPGLAEARRRFRFPIVGLAEASFVTALQLGGTFGILTLGEHWPAMLRDLVRQYGLQDRCPAVQRVDGAPLDLIADPALAARAVATAAAALGTPTVVLGGAALTGLVPRIGRLPGLRLVDCLHAALAQATALIEHARMAGEP